MSLDFELVQDDIVLFETNITHNCVNMVNQAGLYVPLWDSDGYKAKDIIHSLSSGINQMIKNPYYFSRYEAKNGWGTLDQFIPWLLDVLKACYLYQDAEIRIDK